MAVNHIFMISQRRMRILNAARGWIGTPFHHRASIKGVGTDCLGLVRGVWRELYGAEPETLPDYAPDWAEAMGRETMLEAAMRHLTPVATPQPGDVLLFRLTRHGPARHAGIMGMSQPPPTSPSPSGKGPGWGTLQQNPTLIHAWSGQSVCEVPYAPPWPRRMAGAFEFKRFT